LHKKWRGENNYSFIILFLTELAPPIFSYYNIHKMTSRDDLLKRGFTPKGIGGEYIITKDTTTIIVVLDKHEHIEIYHDERLTEAHPIDHIGHVDEVCYCHGFRYEIPKI